MSEVQVSSMAGLRGNEGRRRGQTVEEVEESKGSQRFRWRAGRRKPPGACKGTKASKGSRGRRTRQKVEKSKGLKRSKSDATQSVGTRIPTGTVGTSCRVREIFTGKSLLLSCHSAPATCSLPRQAVRRRPGPFRWAYSRPVPM